MPSYEWSIRGSGAANLGMDVSQSGRYLYVTMYRKRGQSATFNNDPASIVVSVNGSGGQGGSSSANAMPTSLAVGTWYGAALVGAVFDLGYGASNAHIVISWTYSGGWASGSTAYDRSVSPFYDVPAAPTSVAATRVSDTSATLAWVRNATGAAPYASQQVYRSENGGALVDTAALSGAATSYTAATVPNRKYTFLVQSRNSAGSKNSAASNVILTTPAKLAALSGAKVSGGIKLTLSKLDVPYSEAQILVELTTNGGSSWSTIHTFAAGDLSTIAATDWTHAGAPTGGTVQYRATVKTNGGTQGILSSPVTLSNVMVLNVPPLAPTNLAPSGLVDVASPVVLSWGHTPSADGAAQSSRQIQYSADSGATQTNIVAGDSTDQTFAWTVATGGFAPGQTIQWRVRTAGSQPGVYGAWSAWQTVTLRSSLTVNITAPSGIWEGGDIPVAWTASESWGSAAQVAYRIVMASEAATVYDSGTVTTPAPAGVVPAAVQANFTSYTITVTVTDNYGLTSLPQSTLIETDFLAPGVVGLSWAYDDDLGQLVLTPQFSDETSSVLDDTDAWMLERSFDGATWDALGVYASDGPIPDPLVRVGADSWYRTTGFTALGVAGEQSVYLVRQSDVKSRWGWLAYGDGFASQVRFGWSQTVEISSGRASDAYEIEGVDFPAAVFGRQQSERYSVTGKLLYKASPASGGIADSLTTSTAQQFRDLGRLAGICLFRDGDGEYCHARVTEMKVAPKGPHRAGRPDEASVSFTIERVTA